MGERLAQTQPPPSPSIVALTGFAHDYDALVYRPETELFSHHFDAVIHLDETHAAVPLGRTSEWERGELRETYPWGI